METDVYTHHTHDIRQNGTRGANQGTNNGHQVVVQQEPLSTQGPAGVAVEYGDDYRHVGSTNSCRQCDALQIEERTHKHRSYRSAFQ